jgi:aquaporin Z
MVDALKRHWPEYLIEGVCLGSFMVSAAVWTIIIEHPASPIRQALPDDLVRRIFIGLAMGLTAVTLIYSPLGKRSGAHMNPAVTLTFWTLGKVESPDALFYVLSQFVGGLAGLLAAALFIHSYLADAAVNYVVTVPGPGGPGVAFVAELVISFGLMLMILTASNIKKLARYTGLFAGCLVAVYISVEAPLSGMSMNPARTFASAVPARLWSQLWIYFTAPPIGMLLAARAYLRMRGAQRVFCAKLHHENPARCIFRCRYREAQ